MTMTPDVAFIEGLDFFSGAVRGLRPDDWQRASPCAGWRALDVLGHVGSGVRFGTLLLEGKQPTWSPAEPPGANVDGEPAGWWASLVEPARTAVQDADLTQVVDSPMGRRSIGDGLSFPAVDLFVHAWDLARSAGQDVVIPAAAIEFAHSVIDPLPEAASRSERVFAAARQAPGGSPSEVFLAWTGRDPGWGPLRG
jgi:uncharacterized protein (TIGR03086 family)